MARASGHRADGRWQRRTRKRAQGAPRGAAAKVLVGTPHTAATIRTCFRGIPVLLARPVSLARRAARGGEEKIANKRRDLARGGLCGHQREQSAQRCGGASICPHQRERSKCRECGGASICRHLRIRNRCKVCGGASICQHQRSRSQCKECEGVSICQHQRQRSRCKECGGASICKHQRQRSKCRHYCLESRMALLGVP